MRPTQETVRTEISDNEFREDHPAFGCLEVCRISGSPGPMFGSKLPTHDGWVEFRLKPATRYHRHGEDTHYSGRSIVEFGMTYAQFVEIMAQMNRGSGVPCTLHWRQKDDGTTEEYPQIRWPGDSDGTEASDAVRGIEVGASKLSKAVREVAEKVQTEMNASKIPKKTQERILNHLDSLQRDLVNLPFHLTQVREAGEKLIAAARTEYDAVVSAVVRRLGFQKLDEMHQIAAKERDQKQLTDQEK